MEMSFSPENASRHTVVAETMRGTEPDQAVSKCGRDCRTCERSKACGALETSLSNLRC